MRSIRIFLKYVRKFLAGFISFTPFVRVNCKPYPFNKENRVIGDDWKVVGEDLQIAITKFENNHEK
ncbi:MAG: hypothetical protein ACJAW3_000310 [Lentimonas sp.]|jgi:hypothetical protein